MKTLEEEISKKEREIESEKLARSDLVESEKKRKKNMSLYIIVPKSFLRSL